MWPRRTNAAGLTLIELVVVIGLLGVMFGVVFLKLDALLPATRLRSAARELGSNIEQAFNHAVVAGRQVRFEYDLETAMYRFFYPFELDDDGVTIVGEGETPVVDWVDLPDTIRITDVQIGEGDIITSGQVYVTFEPRGVATGHAVHLVMEGTERYYSVLVSPLLGYVDVTAGYVQADVLEDDDTF